MRYNRHPWRKEIKTEHYEALDMDLIRDVFQRNFGDAGALTIYVCDDLSDNEMRELYNLVASLPSKGKPAMAEQLASWPLYKGKGRLVRNHPKKEVPKSEVTVAYKHDIKLNSKEYVVYDILDYIMNARCMNKIREERGGTYSVTFRTEFFPQGKIAESSITFQTRPELTDILVADAQQLMEDMAKEGPTKDEYDNACKYLAKHHIELQNKFKNNLARKLSEHMMQERYGVNRQSNYLRILEKTNAKDVRKMAKKIVNGDSMLSVYTEK